MEEISINIKLAKNGVIVHACNYSDGPSKDETYVYEKLEDALKEIPSLVSVVQENIQESKKNMKTPVAAEMED